MIVSRIDPDRLTDKSEPTKTKYTDCKSTYLISIQTDLILVGSNMSGFIFGDPYLVV